MASLQVPRTHP